MFCPKCGKEVNEETEKCQNCGNVLSDGKETIEVTEEKKPRMTIRKICNILGGILFAIFILYVVKGLLEGRSLTDIMYNPEQGNVDPKEDSGYTYSAPEGLDEVNGAVSERSNTNNEVNVEYWEGAYFSRSNKMIMLLYSNDDGTMSFNLLDENISDDGDIDDYIIASDVTAKFENDSTLVCEYDDVYFKLELIDPSVGQIEMYANGEDKGPWWWYTEHDTSFSVLSPYYYDVFRNYTDDNQYDYYDE